MKEPDLEVKGLSTPPYPPDTFPPEHQVAGHFYGKGKTKLGLLKHTNGYILKPFQTSFRGENEDNFYRTIFNPKCEDPVVVRLRQFIPTYLGVEHLVVNNESVEFLKLEDLTSSFKIPCILDIKIGKETYEPGAPPHKISYEMSKYPLLGKTGIRILGMKIKSCDENYSLYYDKEYGKKLSEADIQKCLETYFQFDKLPKDYINLILYQLIEHLLKIKKWFLVQHLFHFYASSLLFIYDAYQNNENHANCCVKMIDFTHAHIIHDNKIDDNYLFGLNYIINILILLKHKIVK